MNQKKTKGRHFIYEYPRLDDVFSARIIKLMAKQKITIDGLAVMVKKGFDAVDQRFNAVDQRFDAVDQRFDGIEKRLDHMDARLSYVERDVAEIRKHFVYRDEFEDALARLRFVEKKLGINSGK